MPAPTNAHELIEVIRKSQLVSPAELDPFLATHESVSRPADLTYRMVEAGLITPFHAEQLLRGKHRGYFLGKYKLLQRIGMGGMGQVFLAQHTNMNRLVALKVLPPELANNEYTRERFLREARASGQLNHPNLVRALDIDGEGEVLYLVLEYIDGINLHDLAVKHGPLDPARVAQYLWQATQGLSYIHSCGLIHRDIKPANILVDRTGTVKLLDLGLVRSTVEDDELTRGQGVKILGTADFLAPEQAVDCTTVDIRADIYSLGASGYFLLTGQTPFTADKMAQKLIAHQVQPIPHAADARPDVPKELSDLLVWMMAKRAEDRPATPQAIIEALEPLMVGAEIVPSEVEIPPVAAFAMSVASPSAIQLAANTPARTRGGSSVNLQSVAQGGSSAARLLQNDSAIRAGIRQNGNGIKTPPPVGNSPANTPMPKQLADRGSDSTKPDAWLKAKPTAPEPAAHETRPSDPIDADLPPPILPAKQTHGVNSGDSINPMKNPIRIEEKLNPIQPAPAGPTSFRRRLGLFLAVCLTLAIGGWQLALLKANDGTRDIQKQTQTTTQK